MTFTNWHAALPTELSFAKAFTQKGKRTQYEEMREIAQIAVEDAQKALDAAYGASDSNAAWLIFRNAQKALKLLP